MTIVERPWTINDLKEKSGILRRAYEGFRIYAGEESRRHHRFETAIAMFIADRWAMWSARSDVFAIRNPARAGLYEAKLDVFEEFQKLIEQYQGDAGQGHPPA